MSARADDIFVPALREAAAGFQPVPAATEYEARKAAAELLTRYLKLRDGNHFCQYHKSTWFEIQGLRLDGVMKQTLSAADQANRIRERYFVSVKATTYRMTQSPSAGWSKWYDGLTPFFPSGVQVNRMANGTWEATAGLSPFFQYSAHGDLALLPQKENTVAAASGPEPREIAHTKSLFGPEKSSAPLSQLKEPSTSGSGSAIAVVIGMAVFLAGVFGVVTWVRFLTSRKFSARRQPPPLPLAQALAPHGLPFQRCKCLLTPTELAFFAVLLPLISERYLISAKVRLADLFEANPGPGQSAAFNQIRSKHIDFVLVDRATSYIYCGLELDDRSHQRPDRIERDHFVNTLFAQNHLPLIRVPVASNYDPQFLSMCLGKAGITVPTPNPANL